MECSPPLETRTHQTHASWCPWTRHPGAFCCQAALKGLPPWKIGHWLQQFFQLLGAISTNNRIMSIGAIVVLSCLVLCGGSIATQAAY